MLILLKIKKNRDFSWFLSSLYLPQSVFYQYLMTRFMLEIISKILNSFQGFIRLPGGNFMLILLKITKTQYYLWFQQPCELKMETIARYLNRFEIFTNSARGVILCPNFTETSKKSRFVVVLSIFVEVIQCFIDT